MSARPPGRPPRCRPGSGRAAAADNTRAGAGCLPRRAARCPGPAAAAAFRPGHLQYGPLPRHLSPLRTGVQSRHSAGGGPSPPRRGAAAHPPCRPVLPRGTPAAAPPVPRRPAAQRLRPGRRRRRAGRGSHGRLRGCSRTPAAAPATGAAAPCCRPRRKPPPPAAAAAPDTKAGSAGRNPAPQPGSLSRFSSVQRLKSTSMKRVWAPSQPSGTVLVSPWRFLATMHSAVSASTSAPSGFWLA